MSLLERIFLVINLMFINSMTFQAKKLFLMSYIGMNIIKLRRAREQGFPNWGP